MAMKALALVVAELAVDWYVEAELTLHERLGRANSVLFSDDLHQYVLDQEPLVANPYNPLVCKLMTLRDDLAQRVKKNTMTFEAFMRVLPSDWQRLERHLRVADQVVTPNTVLGESTFCSNQILLTRDEQFVHINVMTVWSQRIVPSFSAKLSLAGKLKGGTVNTFGLGIMRIDAGYLEEFYREMCETPIEWDVVE